MSNFIDITEVDGIETVTVDDIVINDELSVIDLQKIMTVFAKEYSTTVSLDFDDNTVFASVDYNAIPEKFPMWNTLNYDSVVKPLIEVAKFLKDK